VKHKATLEVDEAGTEATAVTEIELLTTETTNQINTYVSEKTHGKISKFIEKLDPSTIMYLLSYIYFKGKWSVPFNPKRTREDQFHVDKDTTVPVQMMFVKDDFYSYYDHSKISKFIKQLDPRTIMLLLSYIYFKGKWSVPFDPENTREDQFHVDKDTTVPVQMMFEGDDFYSYYDHELSVRVLRLNYNDSFSMILALPDTNITHLEESRIVSGAQSQNVFFSPLSVSTALATVSLGAGGETHQQLLSGLSFNGSAFTNQEMHQAFLDLLQNLNQRSGVDLDVGTAVYVHDTFKTHPEVLEKLKRFYLSDGFSVDFTKTNETTNQINTCIFPPFDPQMTREDQFHVDKDTTVPVQMMFVEDYFYSYYDPQLSVRVRRLNYNDSFSMILALPDTNITHLEETLRPHHLTKWLKSMSERKFNVYLPKLTLKTSYCLTNILAEMGFKDMFTAKADFSGISDKDMSVSE
ncbi:serine protease inhibitor 2.1-like, partial [Clarias magur]